MQAERLPQHTPQEIHVVTLVPEQAIPAMQHRSEAEGGDVDAV